MSENFPKVSYIVIGSKERLSKVKSYRIEEGVECLLCPFQSLEDLPSLLDLKIAELDSSVISLIPAGAFPRKDARAVECLLCPFQSLESYLIARFKNC